MLRSPVFMLLYVSLLIALRSSPAHAASSEAQVKAAYLYKITSFVRWPESARQGDSMRLCVAGRSDVAVVLQTLVRGQRVDGKPLEVRSVEAGDTQAARSCHVLFLGSGPGSTRGLAGATQGLAVLTVGDRTNRTGGGVIDFIERDGKVRFVIDTTSARLRGLELSSKLLQVAEAVR